MIGRIRRLWSSPSRGKRWALRLTLLIASLLVAELGLRAFVRFSDMEADLYRADEKVGWMTRPHLHKRFDMKRPELHFLANTDARGLRGDTAAPPKAPGERRVLVLGDSFTWGIGVESNETFPAVLERELQSKLGPSVTVVNAGVPCYGTAQELAFYRTYGRELSPDLVVLAYYPNDDADNITKFVFVDGHLWEDPVLVFGHPIFLVELVYRTGVRLAERRGYLAQPPDRQNGAARTQALIAALREDCKGDNRPFFVLQIPAREVTKFVPQGEQRRRHRPLELPPGELIPMMDEIEAQAESPYLPEHHFNPAGHRLAASVLAKVLLARMAASP